MPPWDTENKILCLFNSNKRQGVEHNGTLLPCPQNSINASVGQWYSNRLETGALLGFPVRFRAGALAYFVILDGLKIEQ